MNRITAFFTRTREWFRTDLPIKFDNTGDRIENWWDRSSAVRRALTIGWIVIVAVAVCAGTLYFAIPGDGTQAAAPPVAEATEIPTEMPTAAPTEAPTATPTEPPVVMMVDPAAGLSLFDPDNYKVVASDWYFVPLPPDSETYEMINESGKIEDAEVYLLLPNDLLIGDCEVVVTINPDVWYRLYDFNDNPLEQGQIFTTQIDTFVRCQWWGLVIPDGLRYLPAAAWYEQRTGCGHSDVGCETEAYQRLVVNPDTQVPEMKEVVLQYEAAP